MQAEAISGGIAGALIIIMFLSMFVYARWYKLLNVDSMKQQKIRNISGWVGVIIFFGLMFALLILRAPIAQGTMFLFMLGSFASWYLNQ